MSELTEFCSQCGRYVWESSCGPTHAILRAEWYRYAHERWSKDFEGVEPMSTSIPTPLSPNITVQAHPDDFQSILAGIMAGLQAFQVVEPFILQIIAIEKGQPATVTLHPPQQS